MLLIAASIASSVVRASDDEGLFIVNAAADPHFEPQPEIVAGYFVTRTQAERLKLTRAVFRYDTEDNKKYWLELDFTKRADPGDFYLFKIDGRHYGGFVIRGEGTNEGGGRWALGMTDRLAGSDLLAKIGKAYKLPAEATIDETKDNKSEMATPRKPSD